MTEKATTSATAEAVGAPAVDVPMQDQAKPTINSREGSNDTVNSDQRESQIYDESEEGPTRRASLDTAHEQNNNYANNPKALEAGVAKGGAGGGDDDKEGIIMVDWDGPDDPENPRK